MNEKTRRSRAFCRAPVVVGGAGIWCLGRDSNSHGFRHYPLKIACLTNFTTKASLLRFCGALAPSTSSRARIAAKRGAGRQLLQPMRAPSAGADAMVDAGVAVQGSGLAGGAGSRAFGDLRARAGDDIEIAQRSSGSGCPSIQCEQGLVSGRRAIDMLQFGGKGAKVAVVDHPGPRSVARKAQPSASTAPGRSHTRLASAVGHGRPPGCRRRISGAAAARHKPAGGRCSPASCRARPAV